MLKTKCSLALAAIALGVLGMTLFPAARLDAQQGTFPPWSNGGNNPAGDKGYVFEVPDIKTCLIFTDTPGMPGWCSLLRATSLWCFPGWLKRSRRYTRN